VEIKLPSGASLLPAWAVIIILGREFLVTGLRSLAAAGGHVIQADKLGKHKTGWQLGGIIALLLGLAISASLAYQSPVGPPQAMILVMEILRILVLISVLGLTVISGTEFLRKNWGLFQTTADKDTD
jgi:CDP-diacylglycerol--glycerol-3-phosphate 3-phosphatidyltransferase